MEHITREEFIDWFIQLLKTNESERRGFIRAIKEGSNQAASVFAHGYHIQWRYDAPVELRRPLREIVDVGELALDIVAKVKETFKEQFVHI